MTKDINLKNFKNTYILKVIVCSFLIFLNLYISNSYAAPATWDAANMCRFYPFGDDGTGTGTNYRFPPSTIDARTGEDLSGTEATTAVPFTGLTHRLIECIRSVLWRVQDTQLSNIITETGNYVRALVTLYIIIYGIKILFGNTRNVAGDFMVFVFTAAAVIVFTSTTELRDYLESFQSVQESFIEAVTQNISLSGRCVNTTLDAVTLSPPATAFEFNIWQKIDCTIVNMLGILPYSGASNYITWGGLSADAPPGGANILVDPFNWDYNDSGINGTYVTSVVILFILMGATIFSSVGIIILILGGALIILMISAFAEAIRLYIVALMSLVFLGLVGPIIIPMVMFEATKSIFDNWLRYLFSYTLQPAISFAYLAFMLNILNLVINGGVTQGTGTSIFWNGGLAALYTEVQSDLNNAADYEAFANQVSLIEFEQTSVAESTPEVCDVNSGSSGGNCGNIYTSSYEFSTQHDDKMLALMYYLLIVVLILYVTTHFMLNVMNFGDRLVGLSLDMTGRATNIHNRASHKIKQAINNANN